MRPININKYHFLYLLIFLVFPTYAQINTGDPTPQNLQLQEPQLGQPELRQNTLNPRDSTIMPQENALPTRTAAVSPLDTLENTDFERYKIDGVIAVVGKYLILESDIMKFRMDVESRFPENSNISDCQIVDNMMESKLLSHAALQDSTVYQMVPDEQIENQIEQQLMQLEQQIGSMDKVLKYYRKDSEQEIRDELFQVNKENQLAQAMQEKIMEDVEITPEEVRSFFNDIPEDERPKFSDEVELSQIIIEPKTPQAEIDKVVNQLTEMRNDIVENGASFATKAVLYSQDGTSSNGGKMVITRKDPLDKDFKEIAFSIRPGEVSKPFKSSFGYHIVQVDRDVGQKREIRHIILIPKETQASVEAAKVKADSVRTLIVDKKMSFEEAALRFSDEEDTRGDGGRLINPATGDTRFEMTNIDPTMYNEVKRLKKGEVSQPLVDETRTGQKYYKLILVTGFYPEHIADYAEDYVKIKDLALQNKQMKAFKEWRQEEVNETYIKINDDYKECAFEENWLKN